VLEHEESEVVSLQAELAFIHHYLSLQQIRFRDGLVIDILISPEAKEKRIVMVTLQMLVDNAIKHNEIAAARPLTIGIYDHDGSLCVTNNKQRKDLMGPSTQQGLKQLTTLYAYLTDRPVKVLDTETTFTVEIPLL
jgi:LytS/YehU family sensor histidine kinase